MFLYAEAHMNDDLFEEHHVNDDLFEEYALEALLGEFYDDFDVDGLRDELTEVRANGNRYWKEGYDDIDSLNEVLQRFAR